MLATVSFYSPLVSRKDLEMTAYRRRVQCKNCADHGIKEKSRWNSTHIEGIGNCRRCGRPTDARGIHALIHGGNSVLNVMQLPGGAARLICKKCNKDAFISQAEAKSRARQKTGETELRAYFEPKCDFFHLSSKPAHVRPKAIYAPSGL